MARVPMVTRTIQTTVCKVLCLDLENKQPIEKTIKLPRTYKDEKSMMKKISPMIDSDTCKAVHVISTEIEETLYGMSEQQFIETAQILPARN